jgi:hypothetical protein
MRGNWSNGIESHGLERGFRKTGFIAPQLQATRMVDDPSAIFESISYFVLVFVAVFGKVWKDWYSGNGR